MDSVERHEVAGLIIEIDHVKLKAILEDLGLGDWQIDFHLGLTLLPSIARHEEKSITIRPAKGFFSWRIRRPSHRSIISLIAHEVYHALQPPMRSGWLFFLVYLLTYFFQGTEKNARKWSRQNRDLFREAVSVRETDKESVQ